VQIRTTDLPDGQMGDGGCVGRHPVQLASMASKQYRTTSNQRVLFAVLVAERHLMFAQSDRTFSRGAITLHGHYLSTRTS